MGNPVENIRILRKLNKLSQEEVAKILDIDVSTYSKIEREEIKLTIDRLYEIAEILNKTPEQILSFDQATAAKKEQYANTGNVTYIPVSTLAGSMSEVCDPAYQGNVEIYHLPDFYENDLYMIDVEGDSMYPSLSHGDKVILKQVEETRHLKWGEIYVIDAVDGRVVKRVYKGSDKNALTLKSDNICYEPYEVSTEDIRSIWLVRGILSKNTSFKPVPAFA